MPKKNELMPFTFKDTGVTVKIKKVSPLLLLEVQKAFPPPEPPMQDVVYGDPDDPGAKMEQEPNYAHPDHLANIDEYKMELEEKIRFLMIKRGVVINLTAAQKEEVKELREYWKEEYGAEIKLNDKLLFINYIAIGTDSDIADLIQVISSRSQPTGAAIAEAKAGFQG